MTEGMIQAFVNGGFVILGVFVGALITGLGNILARRRKDKEEQNKAVSCLLSLYFYVFQLYEDPLLESIDSHVKDINKLSDFENEIRQVFFCKFMHKKQIFPFPSRLSKLFLPSIPRVVPSVASR